MNTELKELKLDRVIVISSRDNDMHPGHIAISSGMAIFIDRHDNHEEQIIHPCIIGSLDRPVGVFIPLGHPMSEPVLNDFLERKSFNEWSLKRKEEEAK